METAKDLDDFFNEQPTVKRKVKIHNAGEDSTCTACEG